MTLAEAVEKYTEIYKHVVEAKEAINPVNDYYTAKRLTFLVGDMRSDLHKPIDFIGFISDVGDTVDQLRGDEIRYGESDICDKFSAEIREFLMEIQ